MANNAKIDEILGYVYAYPAAHNQDSHFWPENVRSQATLLDILRSGCGTTGCIAGWAIATISRNGESMFGALGRYAAAAGIGNEADDVAAHILGLNYDQGLAVFYCFDKEAAIGRLKYLKDHPDATAGALARAVPAGEDA